MQIFYCQNFLGPHFRPQKNSEPPFVMKITCQPHRKACKLNFHWKICHNFFTRIENFKGPIFASGPSNKCLWTVPKHGYNFTDTEHWCSNSTNHNMTYIWRVWDQFSQEDFFVGVECVDDKTHQLGNLGLESEDLDILVHRCFCLLLCVCHLKWIQIERVGMTWNIQKCTRIEHWTLGPMITSLWVPSPP